MGQGCYISYRNAVIIRCCIVSEGINQNVHLCIVDGGFLNLFNFTEIIQDLRETMNRWCDRDEDLKKM